MPHAAKKQQALAWGQDHNGHSGVAPADRPLTPDLGSHVH